MKEIEKMLKGEPYSAKDDELTAQRTKVKDLCFDYNHLRPSEFEKQKELLKEIVRAYKGKIKIEPPFYVEYGFNTRIGHNFIANNNLTILDCAPVSIGDNVLFGPNVQLLTINHPIDIEERLAGIEYPNPITIHDNVWIGGGTIVLGGVTIGRNCVIGAGSVVTKTIPANSIAYGNPAKVVKTI